MLIGVSDSVRRRFDFSRRRVEEEIARHDPILSIVVQEGECTAQADTDLQTASVAVGAGRPAKMAATAEVKHRDFA